MEDAFNMLKLASQGFCCSQILIIMDLEKKGIENKDLVKSMMGLCGGIGGSGKTCGLISGGACIFGLYAGKGSLDETKDDYLNKMIMEYIQWFETEYGSANCDELIEIDSIKDVPYNNGYPVKCGNLMTQSYKKIKDILKKYGYTGE